MAALALVIPEDAKRVVPPLAAPVAAVSASAGGAEPPALAPRADLPTPPPDYLPPGCRDQLQIDLPHHRGDDVARRQTKVCRQGYLLSLNVDTQSPDWVMEALSREDLVGPAKRSNKFADDPGLKPDADAKFGQQSMDQSFFLTNMSPQRGIGMNRGAWKYLEEATRARVLCDVTVPCQWLLLLYSGHCGIENRHGLWCRHRQCHHAVGLPGDPARFGCRTLQCRRRLACLRRTPRKSVAANE